MSRCISQHKVWNYYQENSKKCSWRCIYVHMYVQVPDLAHARTTEQPIRRTAHLSLKNRNESRLTTTTNKTTIRVDGERSLLARAIARATDSWERAWMKNRHSARASDSVARVALNIHDPEKRPPYCVCSMREFPRMWNSAFQMASVIKKSINLKIILCVKKSIRQEIQWFMK